MRKHRLVQIIGIVIIAAALVYLILGVIGAISLGGSGLGEGWSSGWRGWLTIPILLATCLGFVALLVFGALLYFLAKIDTNLAEAQQRLAAAAAKPAVVSAPVAVAAGVVAAESAEPASRRRAGSCSTRGRGGEVAAPAAAAVAPAAAEAADASRRVEAPVVAARLSIQPPRRRRRAARRCGGDCRACGRALHRRLWSRRPLPQQSLPLSSLPSSLKRRIAEVVAPRGRDKRADGRTRGAGRGRCSRCARRR